MTTSGPHRARIPVPVVVAAVILVADAVTRVIELPAALAGVAGPSGGVDGPVLLLGAWLSVPVLLAVGAAVLVVLRRRAGVVLVALLLVLLLVATGVAVAGGRTEPVLVVEVVAVAVALALVLTPSARAWLRGPTATPGLPAPRGGGA